MIYSFLSFFFFKERALFHFPYEIICIIHIFIIIDGITVKNYRSNTSSSRGSNNDFVIVKNCTFNVQNFHKFVTKIIRSAKAKKEIEIIFRRLKYAPKIQIWRGERAISSDRRKIRVIWHN